MRMNTPTSISINLPKKEARQVRDTAILFGISADELSRRVIANAVQALLEIPEESLDEYENKEEILKASREGLRDYRSGQSCASFLNESCPK